MDIENLSKRLRWQIKKHDYVENGWPNPLISIMGHSTPGGLDQLINSENMSSGLVGRCLLIRCAEHREQLQGVKEPELFDGVNILNTLHSINTGSQHPLKITIEAEEMLVTIVSYYDEDERLNAPFIGAVYARAIEQIKKISSLLALEDGLIEADHVRYAFALVSRSIEDILFLLHKGEATKANATGKEIAEHTRELIKREIPTEGRAHSSLKQRVLKNFVKLRELINYKPVVKDKSDFYDLIFNRMLEVGDIEYKEEGKKKRYFLV